MSLRKPSQPPAFEAGEIEPPLEAVPDIGAEPLPELEDFSLKEAPLKPPTLDEMSQEDLLRLRGEIDARLEGISLETMDLSKELLVQYRQALALQNATANDKTVPTNQRAQVLNSLVSLLSKITASQLDVHNSERQKTLEQVLVKVLKTMPTELQNAFFEAFEKEVRER